MPPRAVLLMAMCGLVATLAGCRSVDLVTESHYRLDTAYELISKEKDEDAVHLLETLLADVERVRDGFPRQRFYACYLLTQAELRWAAREFQADGTSTFTTRRVNPRVMSAMLYLGCARDVAEAAAAAPEAAPNGQFLIPGRVGAMSIEDASSHLELLVIGFYGALQFNDRMRIALDRFKDLGDLTKLQSCTEVLDRLQIIPTVRPWLLLSVHRALRLSDPREAYRFAMAGLHHDQCRYDKLVRGELIEWINNGSPYVFLCTKCDTKVVPDRPACFNCGESYLTAYGVERETQAK